MLTVCTSAADADLCTTGDVMQILFRSTSTGAVASTGDINYLGTLARRASAWVETQLRYPPAMQVYSESVAGYGRRRLVLGRAPIIKILRMFDSTATCEATEYCSTDYRIDNREAGILERDAGWRWTVDVANAETCFSMGLTPTYRPGSESKPWLVEYVAGWRVSGSTSTATGLTTDDETWTTGATLPGELAQAAAIRAAELYTNPLGVASRSVGDLSVRYRDRNQLTGVMSEAEVLVAPFARIF